MLMCIYLVGFKVLTLSPSSIMRNDEGCPQSCRAWPWIPVQTLIVGASMLTPPPFVALRRRHGGGCPHTHILPQCPLRSSLMISESFPFYQVNNEAHFHYFMSQMASQLKAKSFPLHSLYCCLMEDLSIQIESILIMDLVCNTL